MSGRKRKYLSISGKKQNNYHKFEKVKQESHVLKQKCDTEVLTLQSKNDLPDTSTHCEPNGYVLPYFLPTPLQIQLTSLENYSLSESFSSSEFHYVYSLHHQKFPCLLFNIALQIYQKFHFSLQKIK